MGTHGDPTGTHRDPWGPTVFFSFLAMLPLSAAAAQRVHTVKLDSPVADEESGMGLEVVPLAW